MTVAVHCTPSIRLPADGYAISSFNERGPRRQDDRVA
jgi:hypothetical protein